MSKEADAERYSEWKEKNLAHLREYRRRYYYANRERALEQAKDWAIKNPDKAKAAKQRHADRNIEHNRERGKKYRAANRELHAAATARWRANNVERKAQIVKEWKTKNQHKVALSRVERRLQESRATPRWADRVEMERIYLESIERTRSTGIEYHVDHVVPLRGKLVCGLHCESNMQVLHGRENLRKGNYWWPDMP